jgi:hypothetical protein
MPTDLGWPRLSAWIAGDMGQSSVLDVAARISDVTESSCPSRASSSLPRAGPTRRWSQVDGGLSNIRPNRL